jgi:hypothetical protein
MAMTEDIADELAVKALAASKDDSDLSVINNIAEILGASSQTLQEAFLTSIRVRKAEKRARAVLATLAGPDA